MSSDRRLLPGGPTQFGIWSCLPDPTVLQVVANSAHDFVCVDLQHGYIDPGELPVLLNTIAHAAMPALVRVAWNAPEQIMRVLDLGADGVLVPLVNTASDAERAARSCRYPPAGERSWGPQWSEVRPRPEPEEANGAVRCVVMIETAQALANVEEIAAVEGVDALYVGQNDLSISMGLGRRHFAGSPELTAAIGQILAAGKKHGIQVGLDTAGRVADVEYWAGSGIDFYIVARDLSLVDAGASTAAATLARLRC